MIANIIFHIIIVNIGQFHYDKHTKSLLQTLHNFTVISTVKRAHYEIIWAPWKANGISYPKIQIQVILTSFDTQNLTIIKNIKSQLWPPMSMDWVTWLRLGIKWVYAYGLHQSSPYNVNMGKSACAQKATLTECYRQTKDLEEEEEKRLLNAIASANWNNKAFSVSVHFIYLIIAIRL